MKKTTTLPSLFVLVLVITILFTFKSWFSMGLDLKVWSPLLAIAILISGKDYIVTNLASVKAIFWCFLAYMVFTRGNLNAYIGSFLYILPFFAFCCIKPEIRKDFLRVFNHIFASFLAVSVFFWILHLLGIPLLHSRLKFGEFYAYENYYFFLDFIGSSDYLSVFPRFFSIFIEPGLLGILCVLMISLDGFRLKRWYNIVYLVSLILSFSLAGFVLFAVALIPFVLSKSTGSKWGYITIILIVFISGYYVLYMADENSVAYQMLGQRLEWNEDRGTISGYDRSGEAINEFLEKSFFGSGKVMFGFGPNLQYEGVDWKVFLVKYGVVSLLLYLIFLFNCYLQKKSWLGMWWFLLFVLIFARGYSVMFWPGVLMLYIMGLDYLFYNKNRVLNLWDVNK